jgi:trehalose 6-phosphate synthase
MLAAVADVNNRFGAASWRPVHIEWGAPRSSIAAAYAHADVALVTPFSDGMNLVAKEYVAVGPSDGVLVLSRFAGAAHQLGKWSVLTNPFDTNDLARCIHRAVTMAPQERRIRKAQLLRNVIQDDIISWIDRNLQLLKDCRDDALS